MIPKIHRFENNKEHDYDIKETREVSDFGKALNELFHQHNHKSKKQEICWTPYGYFEYKGKIWPVYDDDAGQCDFIYINNEFVSAGSFTPYPYNVEYFIYVIDQNEK